MISVLKLAEKIIIHFVVLVTQVRVQINNNGATAPLQLLFKNEKYNNTNLSFSVFFNQPLFAQKLPTKQTGNLYISNILIDGSAKDWENKYSAYNNNIECFYAIANDNENLYLIIHAAKSRIMEKIIEGEISFTVVQSGKKSGKDRTEILFPLMPLPICKGVLVSAGKRLTGVSIGKDGEDITKTLDSTARVNLGNSIAKANTALTTNLKELKISGIDEIIDTVPNVTDKTPYYRTLPLRAHKYKIVGINNADGIKAMTQFDEKAELTYELSIPLKYFSLGANVLSPFMYNIKINGRGEDGRPGNTWSYSPPPNQMLLDQDLEEPTDFWGEYTLAKKP